MTTRTGPGIVDTPVDVATYERLLYLLERMIGTDDHCLEWLYVTDALVQYSNKLEKKLDARDRRKKIKEFFLRRKTEVNEMSTDNLKIDSETMNRFRKALTNKFGKYHGFLTPEGSKAIDEYCQQLEAEEKEKNKDIQHGSADSGEKQQLEVVELERIENLDDSLEKIVDGSGV